MSTLEKILLLVLLLSALTATLTMRLWVPVLARACGIRPGAWRALLYALPVALLVLSVWRLFLVNPLPSDEEMVSNFQRHRADLETLVKAYYSAPEPLPGQSRVQWDDSSEVQAIKQRAGVRRIHPTMGYWPPEPYSIEWAKKKMQLIKANAREADTEIRHMEALQVDMLDSRYSQLPLRYPPLIWKSLLYIPAAVRTHDSKLWPPVSARPRTFGRYEDDADRILPDLTNYPPNWKKGECVYRQLDTHWFIRMCRAA